MISWDQFGKRGFKNDAFKIFVIFVNGRKNRKSQPSRVKFSLNTLFIILFRNSLPPTTTEENLKAKARVAQTKSFVDVGFWGGVIPGNQVTIIINTVLIYT